MTVSESVAVGDPGHVDHHNSLAHDLNLKQDVAGNPGSVIAAATLSTNVVVTTAFTAIPGWQIVVPANSGVIELGIPEGLLFNMITGTNPTNTRFAFQARITDEAGAVVAYCQYGIVSSAATAQTWTMMAQLRKIVPNNAADKTYKVEVLMNQAGVNGSTSTIFTSQQGFTDPTLSAVRR